MKRLHTSRNYPGKTLRVFLALLLVVGLAPAVAFGDTTVGVRVEAPVQVNETVAVDGGEAVDNPAAEDVGTEAPADAAGVAPTPKWASSEVTLDSEVAAPRPSQITTDVAIGTVSSTQAETLLVDGLTYQVDVESASATLTGWYGSAPAGDLSIPSQVSDGKTVYKVENAGGGYF